MEEAPDDHTDDRMILVVVLLLTVWWIRVSFLLDDHTFPVEDYHRSVVGNYTCSSLAHWPVLPLLPVPPWEQFYVHP